MIEALDTILKLVKQLYTVDTFQGYTDAEMSVVLEGGCYQVFCGGNSEASYQKLIAVLEDIEAGQ